MLQQFDTCRHCDSVQPSTGDKVFMCRWCGFTNRPNSGRGVFVTMLILALLLLVGGLVETAMGPAPVDLPAQASDR